MIRLSERNRVHPVQQRDCNTILAHEFYAMSVNAMWRPYEFTELH